MKRVLFVTTAFLLVTLSSLALLHIKSKIFSINRSVQISNVKKKVIHVTKPIIKEGVAFPELSAQAVLAIDMDSGTILYEKNPDTPFLPASTTKIITALVALDKYPLDKILTVENTRVEGQKMHLVKGEEISVENLLYGLLVFSANDAAEVLAQNYPGGRDSFIDAMNMKAIDLGLENTFFENPTGIDGNVHVTSAKDLIKASISAMENPFFKKVVRTKEIVVKSADNEISHKLVNINKLIGKVEGVLGVKTGWTESAHENLVSYIERESEDSLDSLKQKRRVMIAILGSQDRFGESEALIEWIFESYKWQKVKVYFP